MPRSESFRPCRSNKIKVIKAVRTTALGDTIVEGRRAMLDSSRDPHRSLASRDVGGRQKGVRSILFVRHSYPAAIPALYVFFLPEKPTIS